MGYVAVRGGGVAIEESLKLLEYERVAKGDTSTVEEIEITFPGLIEQVMGEASLYAPRLAALALKQAQGSPEEAVFLLRAFRSTLERPYISRVIDTEKMQVERRISAAFKDVPGGQLLGATRDYSHRLINLKRKRLKTKHVFARNLKLTLKKLAETQPKKPLLPWGRFLRLWTTYVQKVCLKRTKMTIRNQLM